MSREWKPGDVAMVECSDGQWRRAGYRRPGIGNVEAWEFEGGYLLRVNESRTRPLVVIDPEDREAVERLAKVYRELKGQAELTDEPWSIPGLRMQAALREFANPKPPKPDEPHGLGAVVEDAEGTLWFRMSYENQTWPGEVWQEQYGDADRWSKWESLTAVRVLSPGVEVDQ